MPNARRTTQDAGREHPFEKLEVWHLAQDLILSTYAVARRLPRTEMFGISSQLRRAAVSVALNIAEGRAADSDAEFRRYLGISEKSLVELIACFKICVILEYLSESESTEMCSVCDELQAKIRAFRKRLHSGKD